MVTELMEGLEEVLFDDSRPKRMTRIGTFTSPPVRCVLMSSPRAFAGEIP